MLDSACYLKKKKCWIKLAGLKDPIPEKPIHKAERLLNNHLYNLPHFTAHKCLKKSETWIQIFMDFIGLLQMHMFCGTIISYKIYVEKVSK